MVKRLSFCALASAFVSIAACNRPQLTRTGPAYPRKPESCAFTVLTAPPAGDWTEIGVIDIHSSADVTDIARFKKIIQPKVCEAGGDAALAYVNGQGSWIKATVLKRAQTMPGPGPAPSAAMMGCQFDTQCKGDRICAGGQCVEPPPKASPMPPDQATQ